MSTSTQRLATLIRRTVTGPMWHGQALAELLAGVTVAQAMARPVTGAHTIAELVLHITTWSDIARDRLAGNDPSVDEAMDWPSTDGMDATRWQGVVASLRESYDALALAAEQLGDRSLNERVVGQQYSIEFMLRGVIEHGTYHGGQIALLKRALAGG